LSKPIAGLVPVLKKNEKRRKKAVELNIIYMYEKYLHQGYFFDFFIDRF